MEFVDPRKLPYEQLHSRGELPHLYKPGGIYFVTFRLADAVIYRTRDTKTHSTKVDFLAMADAYDPPLMLGSCVLRRPDVAQIVQDAFLALDGSRYELAAWCIMPNHAHVVFQPLIDPTLAPILQSWKGGTSRRINQLLGRSGSLWERESFDHLIRSEDNMRNFIEYCHANPVIAGLCGRPEEWQFSSAGAGYKFEV
jgi:putative transposase